MNRFIRFGCIGLLSFSNQQLFANQSFASLDAGLARLSNLSSITIQNGSLSTNSMTNDTYLTKHDSQAMVGVTAGLMLPCQSNWFSQYWIGLSFQHFAKQDIGDSVMQYSLSSSHRYRYHWYIQPNTLMVVNRLIMPLGNETQAYAQFGIGVATIDVKGYHENARENVTPRTTPAFADNQPINATYSASIGVQEPVQENLLVTVGYKYQYLGNLTSGLGAGEWSQTALRLKHVDAHMAIVGLTVFSSTMA
ncbi:hypothetical protein [Legionella sp. W05-934-2]|jgi:opacity protein-like surface antigen|uniref:hypothetical protein n=1 Tax=Legionella sp. W05-934-2 TaxID=1198649 RepID=UPI003462E071